MKKKHYTTPKPPGLTLSGAYARFRINGNGLATLPVLDSGGFIPQFPAGSLPLNTVAQIQLPTVQQLQQTPIGLSNAQAHTLHWEIRYIALRGVLPVGLNLKIVSFQCPGVKDGEIPYRTKQTVRNWTRYAETANNFAAPIKMSAVGPGETISIRCLSRRQGTRGRGRLPVDKFGTAPPKIGVPNLVMVVQAHFIENYPELEVEHCFGNPMENFSATDQFPAVPQPMPRGPEVKKSS